MVETKDFSCNVVVMMGRFHLYHSRKRFVTYVLLRRTRSQKMTVPHFITTITSNASENP